MHHVFHIVDGSAIVLAPAGILFKSCGSIWLACLNHQPSLGVILPSMVFGHCSHWGDHHKGCNWLVAVVKLWQYFL